MSKRVVVAGGTGFIGRALVPALIGDDYEAVLLVRQKGKGVAGAKVAEWDGRTVGEWAQALEGAYAVINLAGETISQKWTEEAKDKIVRSRLDSVQAIGAAMRRLESPPSRWLNASAIGFYGNRGDAPLTESSAEGTGFLASTTAAWERALREAALPEVQTCAMRLGVVLGEDGGALPTLRKLAKLGLGGKAGSGAQGISWIQLEDVVEIVLWLLRRPELPMVVNLTAPNPTSNQEFMAWVRRSVGITVGIPAPSFGIRLAGALVGPAPELVLEGAYVLPELLTREGYVFRFPNL